MVGIASAAAIPETQALSTRAGFEVMKSIHVFHSNNNNKYQVRLLGPARVVEGVKAAFGLTKLGVELSKSFFENFLETSGINADNDVYTNKYALFKDSDDPQYGGILGFQLEVSLTYLLLSIRLCLAKD